MTLLWASAQDVTDRWVSEEQIPASLSQIETLLEDAEDVILREFPDMVADVEAGTVPQRRVSKVAARMVIRHLQNPTGLRQVQEGKGPFTEGKTFGGDTPGALALTDEDRADLGSMPAARAYMVDMCPPDPDAVVTP